MTALRPGGTFLYVFQGPKLLPSQAATGGVPVKSWQERQGRFLLHEKVIRDGYRGEACIVIDTAAGEITEYRERQKAMAFSNVLGYLRDAGFAKVNAYKDFEKGPATAEDFSVFVCTR